MTQAIKMTQQFLREQERWLIGYLCRWNELCRGVLDDGSACWNVMNRDTLDPDDLDTVWLAKNRSVRFVTAHHPESDWGWWSNFANEQNGLRGMAVVDDGPAFRELRAGFHEGRITHLSFHATVFRSKERTRPGPDGLPIFDILEARLVEAGPVDEPADDGAEILTIGGREAEWRDVVRRDQVMRNLPTVPRLAHAEGEYRWGHGFGPR